MNCNQLQSIIIDYNLLEKITIVIDYKSFKHPILVIIIVKKSSPNNPL